MAYIIGLDERKNALNEINGIVKNVESVNELLNAKNPTGEFTFSMLDENNKKLKTKINFPNKADFDKLLESYKDRIRSYVLELAKKNEIDLDEDDKRILGILDDNHQEQEAGTPYFR